MASLLKPLKIVGQSDTHMVPATRLVRKAFRLLKDKLNTYEYAKFVLVIETCLKYGREFGRREAFDQIDALRDRPSLPRRRVRLLAQK